MSVCLSSRCSSINTNESMLSPLQWISAMTNHHREYFHCLCKGMTYIYHLEKKWKRDKIGNENTRNQYQLILLILLLPALLVHFMVHASNNKHRKHTHLEQWNIQTKNAKTPFNCMNGCAVVLSPANCFTWFKSSFQNSVSKVKRMMAEFMHTAYYNIAIILFYAKAIFFSLITNGSLVVSIPFVLLKSRFL